MYNPLGYFLGSIIVIDYKISGGPDPFRLRKDAVAFGMVDFCVNPLPGIVAVPCAEPEMDACVYALYQRGSEHVSSALELITRIRKICNEAYGVDN